MAAAFAGLEWSRLAVLHSAVDLHRRVGGGDQRQTTRLPKPATEGVGRGGRLGCARSGSIVILLGWVNVTQSWETRSARQRMGVAVPRQGMDHLPDEIARGLLLVRLGPDSGLLEAFLPEPTTASTWSDADNSGLPLRLGRCGQGRNPATRSATSDRMPKTGCRATCSAGSAPPANSQGAGRTRSAQRGRPRRRGWSWWRQLEQALGLFDFQAAAAGHPRRVGRVFRGSPFVGRRVAQRRRPILRQSCIRTPFLPGRRIVQ